MNDLPLLQGRFLAAQLVGDKHEAMRIVRGDGLSRGVSVPDLYLDVIQESQHRIGDLWRENRVSVAQEHLATAIANLAVTSLYSDLPRPPLTGRRALVACVGGELHDLGARMAADSLEMAGIDTQYLGASVPTDSLVAQARDQQPDLIVLSMTMSFHLHALRDAVARLREELGDRLLLAVGGRAFTLGPTLIEQLGPHVYGRDARESLAGARRVLNLVDA